MEQSEKSGSIIVTQALVMQVSLPRSLAWAPGHPGETQSLGFH